MKPATGFKAQGSFGVPQHMQDQVTRHQEEKARPQPESAAVPKGEFEKEEKEPEVKLAKEDLDSISEQDRERSLLDLKKAIEKTREAAISEEDVTEYIFKGRLIKELVIVPGYVKGRFQTLTPDELGKIDVHMANFRDAGKYTPSGAANEEAIVTLGYSWLGAQGKPIGKDNTQREQNIRNMGALFVDQASRTHTDLSRLLQIALQEKSFVKKS